MASLAVLGATFFVIFIPMSEVDDNTWYQADECECDSHVEPKPLSFLFLFIYIKSKITCLLPAALCMKKNNKKKTFRTKRMLCHLDW